MADPIENFMEEYGYDYDYSNYTEMWETEEYAYVLNWVAIVSLVLTSPALVAGLIANILLLVVFATTPRLITGPNVLFLQRAIVDLIFLLCVPQFMHFQVVGNAQIGVVRCKALSTVVQVSSVAGIVLLMAYTLDSYLAVNPQQHSDVFRRNIRRVTSAAAWGLAIATGIAASVLTDIDDDLCKIKPIFDHSGPLSAAIQMFLVCLVPLVVVWVFVNMAYLPPRTEVKADSEEVKNECPNFRLLVSLASTFTVLQGVYWVVFLLSNIFFTVGLLIAVEIVASLNLYAEALNPILVIYLSKDLRERVVGWLPFRRSSALVPMRDI